MLQYDVKEEYRMISRKFLGMKFFHPSVRLTNQNPHICIHLTNQSNRSISVRFVSVLLVCFHSKSYENRSNITKKYTVRSRITEYMYYILNNTCIR